MLSDTKGQTNDKMLDTGICDGFFSNKVEMGEKHVNTRSKDHSLSKFCCEGEQQNLRLCS